MRKLLDVTDRRVRALQHIAALVSMMLFFGGLRALRADHAPAGAVAAAVAGFVMLILVAGIKQRWEIEYKGHRIRFENSPITAEKLYLDDGLVARGGIGFKMELRAPIRVGDGVGEEIMVLADAGLTRFRVRIFTEGGPSDGTGPGATAPPAPNIAASEANYATAVPDPHPLTQSAVVGRLVLAKQVVEIASAAFALLGAAGTVLVWLF